MYIDREEDKQLNNLLKMTYIKPSDKKHIKIKTNHVQHYDSDCERERINESDDEDDDAGSM